MASAQVDAAAVEEVIQDKNSSEESCIDDEQTHLPKSIDDSEVVVHDHEEDEVGEHEFEGEVKNFEDEENLDDKITDSPIIGEDEPNSTFDDDDEAEDDDEEESDKI